MDARASPPAGVDRVPRPASSAEKWCALHATRARVVVAIERSSSTARGETASRRDRIAS